MKLISNVYRHTEKSFHIKVTTCNSRIATTEQLETGEIVKFSRPKLEWMIKKNIFEFVKTDD